MQTKKTLMTFFVLLSLIISSSAASASGRSQGLCSGFLSFLGYKNPRISSTETDIKFAFHPLAASFAEGMSIDAVLESLRQVVKEYPVKGHDLTFVYPHFYIRWGALLLKAIESNTSLLVTYTAKTSTETKILSAEELKNYMSARTKNFKEINKIFASGKRYDPAQLSSRLLTPLFMHGEEPIYLEDVIVTKIISP